MVAIPEGDFDMGSDLPYPTSPMTVGFDQKRSYGWQPRHRVHLSAFCIHKYEVTVREYKTCVDAKQCTVPSRDSGEANNTWGIAGKKNHPVTLVSYEQSIAYCQSQGWRIPTEAEWEYAARGADGRDYPWGNMPDGGVITCQDSLANESGGRRLMAGFGEASPCHKGVHGTWEVGSAEAGASPFGVLDMAGNVMEWVEDVFDPGFYKRSPLNNPRNPPKNVKNEQVMGVVRGGGWSHGGGKPDLAPGWNSRTYWREPEPYYEDGQPVADAEIGFRCAAVPEK